MALDTIAPSVDTPSRPTSESTPLHTPTEPGGLRLRALLIGVPLVVAICLLSVYGDLITKSVQIGTMQIAPPAVFVLFILILANLGFQRLMKKALLNASDLIIIYGMVTVGVLVSTRGLMEKLIPPLAYLPYYTTSTNKLNTLITQNLPAWALPFSPSIAVGEIPPEIQGYFEGMAQGQSVPWSFWVGPLVAWFTLIALTIWVFACLASILRRQWMDHEQLRFPLTVLPLSMIRDEAEGEPFFRNRLMWLGFGIAAGVFFINGLSSNYPDWPKFVLDLKLNNFLTERPWNAMGPIQLFVSFAAIGMAYFLPVDFLFSIWFFFLVTRYQDAMAVQLGGLPTPMGTHDTRLWNGFQAAGAYVVLVLAQLRIGWPYYKKVWQTAFTLSPHHKPLDDSNEMMSYRVAVFGAIAGFGGIVLWLTLAGMNPLIAALQMGIYIFVVSMIMTRAVSEGGWIQTETSFLPSHLIGLFTPLQGLGPTNLSLMAFNNTMFARDMRGVLFSPILDFLKLAKETNTRFRALATPLFIAVVVSFVTAAAFYIYLGYTHGALSFYQNPNNNAKNMINMAASDIQGSGWKADSTAYGGFTVGVVATIVMIVMRSRFDWFPLNPLAYAIVPSWSGFVLWFSFFLAWAIKVLILRFGGVGPYRKLAPLMIGLVLGEFTMQVFWVLVVMLGNGWSAPAFR
jgi:hypothetical protein